MEVLKMKNPTKNDLEIRNAGIVILNNYIPMLFERLGLVEHNKFTNIENQKKAVKYLQYVITGLPNSDEAFLPLNKILCGLPVNEKAAMEIEITPDQKMLIQGLIQASISHWPEIGISSIEGFRGNWLVRDGILAESQYKWELIVQKRAYDILINRSPFSFSIIKYPWMEKPLYVTWPY